MLASEVREALLARGVFRTSHQLWQVLRILQRRGAVLRDGGRYRLPPSTA